MYANETNVALTLNSSSRAVRLYNRIPRGVILYGRYTMAKAEFGKRSAAFRAQRTSYNALHVVSVNCIAAASCQTIDRQKLVHQIAAARNICMTVAARPGKRTSKTRRNDRVERCITVPPLSAVREQNRRTRQGGMELDALTRGTDDVPSSSSLSSSQHQEVSASQPRGIWLNSEMCTANARIIEHNTHRETLRYIEASRSLAVAR